MYALRWAPLGALAMALAGCTGPAAMTGTAADFNETIARAADSQLLLNIIRAANRNPTHYGAITLVRDSRNIGGTATATPQAAFGPDALASSAIGPALTATGSLSPSFDYTPLDNRTAAEGLFRPIDEQILTDYWQHGWPHMVLLFTFVDSITLNDAASRMCGIGRGSHTLWNNAYHFVQARAVFDCIADRIDAEPSPKKKPILSNAPIAPALVLRSLAELDKNGFTVKEQTNGHSRAYSVSKDGGKWGLTLHVGGMHTPIATTTQSRNSASGKNEPSVSFTLRSVDSMIYYLGELVRLEQRYNHPLTYIYRDKKLGPTTDTVFQVEVNAAADTASYVTADFLGARYSVSRELSETDHSLSVLALVSQLFSLYREEKELPKTSAVEVVGSR
jgi:hypothetical protein